MHVASGRLPYNLRVAQAMACLAIVMLLVACSEQSSGGSATSVTPDAAVEADRDALVALYGATDGESWKKRRQLAQ